MIPLLPMDKPVPPGYYLTDRSLSFSDSLHLNIEGSMTKHFRDDEGRRWKAWRASRDVFWPEAKEAKEANAESEKDPPESREAVIFVCFSDPSQPQRRAHLPSGAFESLSAEDLKSEFVSAAPDPALS